MPGVQPGAAPTCIQCVLQPNLPELVQPNAVVVHELGLRADQCDAEALLCQLSSKRQARRASTHDRHVGGGAQVKGRERPSQRRLLGIILAGLSLHKGSLKGAYAGCIVWVVLPRKGRRRAAGRRRFLHCCRGARGALLLLLPGGSGSAICAACAAAAQRGRL